MLPSIERRAFKAGTTTEGELARRPLSQRSILAKHPLNATSIRQMRHATFSVNPLRPVLESIVQPGIIAANTLGHQILHPVPSLFLALLKNKACS